ncbi:hypothetical protein Hanom_Chr02g00152121 [Helianthus anomalus]
MPTGGWVTGFSPELVVDSGYSRSTPFVQWVSREYSGLSFLAVQKISFNFIFCDLFLYFRALRILYISLNKNIKRVKHSEFTQVTIE